MLAYIMNKMFNHGPILAVQSPNKWQLDLVSYPWGLLFLTLVGLILILLSIFALSKAIESLSQRVREKSQIND